MANRTYYEVRWSKRNKDWTLRQQGTKVNLYICSHKDSCVQHAAQYCRDRLRDLGLLSELVIKRQDNTIQDTRTYGRDPRRSKG